MKKSVILLLQLFFAMTTMAQTTNTALIRGRIINVPSGQEEILKVIYTDPLHTIFQEMIPLSPDSLGRFEVEVPLIDKSPVFLVWATLVITPGETYHVEMDGATGKVTVSGRDALLSNEINQHELPCCALIHEEMKTMSDDVVLEAAKRELERIETEVDSIANANPTLSQEWRQYAHYQAVSGVSSFLVQRRYVSPTVRKSDGKEIWKWLHDHYIWNLPHPNTLIQNDLGYIVMNYVKELISPRGRKGLNLRAIETAFDITEEQQANGIIHRTTEYMDSLRTMRMMLNDYKALSDNNVPDSVLANHPFTKAAPQFFKAGDQYMNTLITKGIVGEQETIEDISRLYQLDLPEDVRDYARSLLIYSQMENFHIPLSPVLLKLTNEIKNISLRDKIISQSAIYQALATDNNNQNNLMSNDALAGLTDGKEIFSKIIHPYRGRIIFIDFWGTWCSPCKYDLKNHTAPLHQALSDLPVTYLYLCNGSTDEAWRSTIAEYHLIGEHLIHYNLPASQQRAVEQYLQVQHFPTYIIFDRNGQRVTAPDAEPRPIDAASVRHLILELENTK